MSKISSQITSFIVVALLIITEYTSAQECADKTRNCIFLAKKGYCKNKGPLLKRMRLYCPKTCKFPCGKAKPTTDLPVKFSLNGGKGNIATQQFKRETTATFMLRRSITEPATTAATTTRKTVPTTSVVTVRTESNNIDTQDCVDQTTNCVFLGLRGYCKSKGILLDRIRILCPKTCKFSCGKSNVIAAFPAKSATTPLIERSSPEPTTLKMTTTAKPTTALTTKPTTRPTTKPTTRPTTAATTLPATTIKLTTTESNITDRCQNSRRYPKLHCDYWASLGYCEKYHRWNQFMRDHCAGTCKICS